MSNAMAHTDNRNGDDAYTIDPRLLTLDAPSLTHDEQMEMQVEEEQLHMYDYSQEDYDTSSHDLWNSGSLA